MAYYLVILFENKIIHEIFIYNKIQFCCKMVYNFQEINIFFIVLYSINLFFVKKNHNS